MQKNKFTLLELLIVVSIIAIIAGILLPAFSKIREKAQGITCAANLKQQGQASINYTGDYSGNILPAYLDIGLTPWFKGLYPYILPAGAWMSDSLNGRMYRIPAAYGNSFKKIFFCPSSEVARTVNTETGDAWDSCTYGLNTFNGDASQTTNTSNLDFRKYFGKLARVKSPSVKFSLAETAKKFHYYGRPATIVRGNDIVFRHLSNFADNVQNPERPDRLNGTSNILFVDGHTSSIHYYYLQLFNFNGYSKNRFSTLDY